MVVCCHLTIFPFEHTIVYRALTSAIHSSALSDPGTDSKYTNYNTSQSQSKDILLIAYPSDYHLSRYFSLMPTRPEQRRKIFLPGNSLVTTTTRGCCIDILMTDSEISPLDWRVDSDQDGLKYIHEKSNVIIVTTTRLVHFIIVALCVTLMTYPGKILELSALKNSKKLTMRTTRLSIMLDHALTTHNSSRSHHHRCSITCLHIREYKYRFSEETYFREPL